MARWLDLGWPGGWILDGQVLIWDDFPHNFVTKLSREYKVPDALHRYSFEELVTLGSMRGAVIPASFHGVGWLGLVTGLKHWFLLPPKHDGAVSPPSGEWPGFQPTCEYHQDVQDKTVLHCVQRPGEVFTSAPCHLSPVDSTPRNTSPPLCLQVFFLPEGTWHSTCNLVKWSVGIGAQGYVPAPAPPTLALFLCLYRMM